MTLSTKLDIPIQLGLILNLLILRLFSSDYIYKYVFKSVCKIKYIKILKKGTFFFGHLSSKNYVCENRVNIGGSKHGIVTIEKTGGAEENGSKKYRKPEKLAMVKIII